MPHKATKKDSTESDDLLEASSDPAPTDNTAKDEDKAIAEIAEEADRDALDDLYEKEGEHEEPMIVLGDEKHQWFHIFARPKFWFGLLLVLIVAFIFVWLITPSRLWALNVLGQRTTVSIGTFVSASDGAPPILKNAKVSINGKDYTTDDHGKLSAMLPYGDTHIVISKQGYAPITKNELLDFDPFFHYLGGAQADESARHLSFVVQSVGIPVKFLAKDWLTGQPITTGHFSVGDVETTPNVDGQVSMIIPATDAKTITVQVKFDGIYADTQLQFDVNAPDQHFDFVNAGRDYFISKRTGYYGVYSARLDGSDETEVVPGSANETGDIAFSQSPSGKYGVLASTRDATRDSAGSVQQKLYVVDLTTKKLTAVDTALRFTLADWSGDDTLVYHTVERGDGNALVSRIGRINVAAAQQANLANANGVVVARVCLASVVYLTEAHELRTVRLQGGDKSLGTNVTQFVQTDPEKFAYQTDDHIWHQYDVNSDQVTTTTTPTSLIRVFVASPSGDGQNKVLVDKIDGALSLIVKKIADGQETKLLSNTALSGPIKWVGNVVVYRAGSADYVVSPGGGQPKKITDVTSFSSDVSNYFNLN